MTTEIVKIDPIQYGLTNESAQGLTTGLDVILGERKQLIEMYKDAMTWEITPLTVSKFESLRIRIKDNRTKKIEPWHKSAKAYFLAGGKFCDAVKNKEVAINENMENELLKAEKFFINQEIKRLADLKAERLSLLEPYSEFVFATDVETYSKERFEQLLAGARLQYEAKKEQERQAEILRIETERKKAVFEQRKAYVYESGLIAFNTPGTVTLETSQSEFDSYMETLKVLKYDKAKEQAELKAENDRLKKEADRIAKEQAEKDRLAEIESDRIAKEQAENLRLANDKAMAEQKRLQDIQAEKDRLAEIEMDKKKIELKQAKEQAENLIKEAKVKEQAESTRLAKIETDRIAAEKKAANAGDKEKIMIFIKQLGLLSVPTLQNKKNEDDINILKNKFLNFLNKL